MNKFGKASKRLKLVVERLGDSPWALKIVVLAAVQRSEWHWEGKTEKFPTERLQILRADQWKKCEVLLMIWVVKTDKKGSVLLFSSRIFPTGTVFLQLFQAGQLDGVPPFPLPVATPLHLSYFWELLTLSPRGKNWMVLRWTWFQQYMLLAKSSRWMVPAIMRATTKDLPLSSKNSFSREFSELNNIRSHLETRLHCLGES